MSQNIIPHKAIHPGMVLRDELAERGIKQRDFAFEISMKPTMLNEILKGKRSITADISILLEKALDIPADFWMNYQTQYEIDLARIKERNIIKAQNHEYWKIIKQYVPVKFYRKEGVLSDDIVKDIDNIKQIYRANSIDDIVNDFAKYKSAAFFRKSEKLQINKVNVYGWTKLASWQAEKENVSDFNPKNFLQLKDELHNIFYENINVRSKTKNVLAKHGIKLIFLKKFEKTPIDGYSFWTSSNPAIALTLRHKRIDNFAFTIFHELGHIFKHLNKDKTIEFIDLESKVASKTINIEKEADEFAQTNLISQSQWNELDSLTNLDDQQIISFSKKYSINPAIILGRICWEKDNYAIKTTIDKHLN
ncbi:MAG: HigA family addiction module antidote protein [Bacteroidales bacterium]|nr:HigA family addiction module antidote protein [Bacteroidales bacterium]